MSGTLRDVLKIAAVVITTLMLIALIFTGVNKASTFTDAAYEKIDNMSAQVSESDYARYDGTIVSGSDVIAAIKYFSGDAIHISVTNSSNTECHYIKDDDTLASDANVKKIADAQNKVKLDSYISPNEKYICGLKRTGDPKTGTVVGIYFNSDISVDPVH